MGRDLTDLTGGLVGHRNPAAPLLTLYDGDARVELSGATAANWVAKSANLLVDGLGAPHRVGLLLPLHWQSVCLLMSVVATDAAVVLAAEPADLDTCDVAFVLAEQAEATIAAGVGDVLALSGHPLGLAAAPLPAHVLDYALEVPSYGDHYSGSRPGPARIEIGASSLPGLSGVGPTDRVLTRLALSDPAGAAVLLAALSAGASLVLMGSGDPDAVAAAERVTVTAGASIAGLTLLA